MLLALLPKVLLLPKIDGLDAVLFPNEGVVPNAGADPLADAARDPNPPPLLALLLPNVDDPKTGPVDLGADAASAPNPPPPLLLLLLPKAGALPKADALPTFDGLPKAGAEVLALLLLLLLPPNADGLPKTGPELALDAPNAGVMLVEDPNAPPVVLPNSPPPPEGFALNAANGLALELVLVAALDPKGLLLAPKAPVEGFPKGEGVVPNAELPPNMGVLLVLIPKADLEDSVSSPVPNDGTSFPEASISPQAEMTTSTTGFCDLVSTWLNVSRPSIPFSTSPKTTCLPLRYGTGLSVKKNCEELVFFPLLAMERSPFLE